jgi:hypothetical protein
VKGYVRNWENVKLKWEREELLFNSTGIGRATIF